MNLRAARMDTMDIHQDLQDIANGIEVIHAADKLKAAKAQKRVRRETAKRQKIRKAERMILTYGWAGLDEGWRRRAEKLLDDDRITELAEQWAAAQVPKPSSEDQLSIFDAA